MSATVREQIIAAIIAGLEGIESIGAVIDAGRRGIEAGQELEAAIGAGKYAAELSVLDDERDDAASSHDLEAMRFVVVVILHMPTVIGGDLEPYQAAARGHELVRQLYSSAAGAERWGDLAQDTTNMGGGGVGIHEDLGTVCTVSAFEVLYRYRRTDAGVAQ
jgi:hypothetical protein